MNPPGMYETPANCLLNAEEVAQRLRISLPLAYRLIQRGEIRAIRVGRLVRVREMDLEDFILKHVSGGA